MYNKIWNGLTLWYRLTEVVLEMAVKAVVITTVRFQFDGCLTVVWLRFDCHDVVRLDDHHTYASPPRIITGRSSNNWLPFWSWLAATARTPAPFRDPADRRRYTLQHSCRMVRGSSSWPLWVDAKDLCCLRDLMMVMMIRAGRPMYVWCSSHLCSCGRHVCVRLSC